MKTVERDGLLLMLAAASGSADGWSFFGMGHAFVANMTGNTVLLGIAVFHPTGDAVSQLIAVAGYVLGTVVGTLLARRTEPGALWGRAISRTLLVEAMLLCGADAVWIAKGPHPATGVGAGLLAAVAVAIGVQSGAMVQLRIPGVVTTYITGTWTTLTGGLALLLTGQPQALRDKTRLEERLEVQGGVLAAYFAAAVLTGWALREAPRWAGTIPAAAVLLVAVYGAARN